MKTLVQTTGFWMVLEYDKDEFIRYNCSQQIDNVNNTAWFYEMRCLITAFLLTNKNEVVIFIYITM